MLHALQFVYNYAIKGKPPFDAAGEENHSTGNIGSLYAVAILLLAALNDEGGTLALHLCLHDSSF